MLGGPKVVVIGFAGAAAILGIAAGVQTIRLLGLQGEIRSLRSQIARPPPPAAIPLLDQPAGQFAKSFRTTIPDIFWGEFAEDVHDCGTAQSFVVTDKKLMVKGSEEEAVEQVRWTKPKLIALTTRGDDFLQRAYEMELSPDSNEITFIFTNMKVIRQRCSARAHDAPTEPLVENVDMNAAVDMNAMDASD